MSAATFTNITQDGFQVYCHPKNARLDLDIAGNTYKQADTSLRFIKGRRSLFARGDIAQVGDDVTLAAEKRELLEERPNCPGIVGEPGDPDNSERVLARVE